MILPIYTYGNDILKKECREVTPEMEGIDKLIENMFDTMYGADGIGLAAPQIGQDLQLFVCDIEAVLDEEPTEAQPYKRVFINAEITESSTETEPYNEGCLSLPGINEDVVRPVWVELSYQNENFEQKTERFEGMWARVIQHEYDHTQGKVFSDRLSPLKRQLLRSKLQNMARGKFTAKYRCQ